MKFIFILIIIASNLIGFASETYRDSSLKKNDAPKFLISATPPGSEVDDVEYFVKHYSSGKKTYELKYEVNDEEVSISYSSDGTFLEKEEDKKFSSLPDSIQEKINSYLKEKYGKFKITETEIRTTPQDSYIDVEVSHAGSKSGVTEVSFSREGNYISSEEEKIDQIETLN